MFVAKQVLGKTTHIKGEFAFDGDITIDGRVDGKITARTPSAKIVVGPTAVLNVETLSAHTIEVFGTVSASVVDATHLVLHGKSQVNAHLKARVLDIKEGTCFNGPVTITTEKVEPVVAGSAALAKQRLEGVMSP